MHRKIAYVYAFEGMADWEIGYLTAELASGRYFKTGVERINVKTFSSGREPVVTMGGLRIIPDLPPDSVQTDTAALLVLPGGDSWMDADAHAEALGMARRFLQADLPVAAICGATIALGREGFLDERAHTSNNLEFLKQLCPSYRGEALYRDSGSVTDRDLVTASGLAPLEFAREVFKLLDVMSSATLEAWYDLNRNRSPESYFALMASLEA